MQCSCLSVLLVYATRRTTNCVALAILIGTYHLASDTRARRGNACDRTCKTKMKMPPKLQLKLKYLKLKNTAWQ